MASKGKSGGPTFHKEGCACRVCMSRRRQTEALPITTRNGRNAVNVALEEQINADHPLIAQNRSIRSRIMQWMAMRTENPAIKNIEVAEKLGITARTLNSYITIANKEGWLKFDDPHSRIEHEIIPKALDNLSLFLDQKDKTATIETVKGTVFKTYQESKGVDDSPTTVLALKIETVGDPGSIKVVSGHIVGKAKELTE